MGGDGDRGRVCGGRAIKRQHREDITRGARRLRREYLFCVVIK